MKFNVIKADLIDKLQKVTNVIGTRSTLPILSNVMIEADNNTLTLTTTDLEVRIKTKLEAKVEKEGKTTLPAKTLFSMVRGLPGENVDMESDESHHMLIKSEKSSYNLFGLAPDDFPLPVQFSPIRRLTLKQEELVRMLSRISYAASTDDSRKTLNGILFNIKENAFTVVATDGKRLALVEKVAENFSGDDGQAIVPSKSVMEIQRLFAGGNEEVSVEFGESQVSFSMEGRTLTSKLVEGSYPNYRQVIPTSFSRKIEIPATIFSSALQRISNVVSESNSYVNIKFDSNCIDMQASSTEIGEGSETVDIEYSGPEVTVSFNPVFVLAPFKHLDADKITLQLNDGYNPVALSCGDGFLYVIMPMRNK
jgi:DNA polymerase III subunit beta